MSIHGKPFRVAVSVRLVLMVQVMSPLLVVIAHIAQVIVASNVSKVTANRLDFSLVYMLGLHHTIK